MPTGIRIDVAIVCLRVVAGSDFSVTVVIVVVMAVMALGVVRMVMTVMVDPALQP